MSKPHTRTFARRMIPRANRRNDIHRSAGSNRPHQRETDELAADDVDARVRHVRRSLCRQ